MVYNAAPEQRRVFNNSAYTLEGTLVRNQLNINNVFAILSYEIKTVIFCKDVICRIEPIEEVPRRVKAGKVLVLDVNLVNELNPDNILSLTFCKSLLDANEEDYDYWVLPTSLGYLRSTLETTEELNIQIELFVKN